MSGELLAAAAAKLGEREWGEARGLYEQALDGEESAEALEGFAIAAWWGDDVDAAIVARERAYALRREAGETVEAARDAGFLAWDYGAMRGVTAVANGWLQRARRLISELPPSAEHAWLPMIEASFHLDTDANEVLRLATEAAERAKALGGLDVEMTARTLQGLALVTLGRVEEGTRLLDEGTAAATAGELHDPIAIGSCCCNMIIACERSRDFERAGQWCEQLAAYCERTGQRPLLALCRAHHGTVLTMRGEWREAEEELEWAAGELSTLRPPLAAYARVRFAELRRRQGRDRDAAELLGMADGHPFASVVRGAMALDCGDPTAAAAFAEKHLRNHEERQPLETATALELLVAARISLGDMDAAREAHGRLAAVAEAVATDSLRAAERMAGGRIALADRDPDGARRALEDAIDLYGRSTAPFDAAVARTLLAQALADTGRPVPALEESLAARAVFAELGAECALKEADKLVGRLGGKSDAAKRAGLTRREVEVLSLVADGLSNPKIAERLVVSEHTVHRHLANVYAKLGVGSRAAAVAAVAEHDLLS